MLRRISLWIVILLVMAFAGWWVSPRFLGKGAQAARQQAILLNKTGQHDWRKVASMVASDYHDGTGMNKEEALQTAKEIFDSFLTVDLQWSNPTVTVEDKTVTLAGTIRMKATGPAGGSMITDRVNKIQQPWTFVWRKDGWNPDDWYLISVSNPEVEHITP